MKSILALLTILLTAVAHADQPCILLANYVGSYLLVNKTCDGPFGGDLTVESAEADASNPTPFIISSGGIGIGPATSSKSSDSCIMKDGALMVRTCTDSSSCRPQNWVYTFVGKQVTFSANGCQAIFLKE